MKKILPLVRLLSIVVFSLLAANSYGQIAQRGASTTNFSRASTLTIPKPTGVVAGDVMVVNISQYGYVNPITIAPSLSGWTRIVGRNMGDLSYGTVLYKVATASEPTTYTFNLDINNYDYANGSIVAFSGVDVTGGKGVGGTGSGPFDVTGTMTTTTGTGLNIAPPSITTTTPNAAVILLAQSSYYSNTWLPTAMTTTSPGVLTQLYSSTDGGYDYTSVGAAWGIKTTAGATGAGAAPMQGTAAYRGGVLIALKAVTSSPNVTATTLTAFGNICTNTTALPNSFNITATNLTGNIILGALAGYTYSTTSGGTYTSTLSLSPTSGSISQTVFVKFSPTAVQSYNGNIPITGGGLAATVNVAASGAGVNSAPTLSANGTATTATINSATITGSTISAIGCSAVSAYGLEYSTTSGFANGTGTKVAGTGFSGAAGGTFSTAISGLTPATIYYYKAYATNSGGTSYFGTQGTFTTACAVPNNPGAITVNSLSSTGFTLNYAAASPAPSSYILFYSTGNVATTKPTLVAGTTYVNGTTYSFGGNNYICLANSTVSPFNITGATSNTQYNLFLYSKSTTNSCFGNPYYSTGVTVTTITCPDAPTAPVTSPIGLSTATVSWTAAAIGSGAAGINYTLEVYTDSGFTMPFAGSPFNTGTAVTKALTGLSPATNYYYRIKANNGSCDSSYLTGAFATLCIAPVITGIAGERCGAGTVNLSASTDVASTVNWFATATGGPSIFSGTNFTTPSISSTTDYFAEAAIPSAPVNIPIGSGALTTTSSGTSSGNYVSPFSHYYGGYKSQYIIRKDELDAAGFKAGSLTSLSLDVTSAGTTYNGFAINIGNTTNTAATATFATPSFTNVFSGNVTPTVGVFTINFTTPFEWDGTSNVIVQLCWSNNNVGGTAAEVKYDTSSFVSMAYFRVDSATPTVVCSAATASGTLSARPRIYFNNVSLCKSSPRTKVTATINPAATPITILATTTSSGGSTACDVDYVELKATGGLVNTLSTILVQDFNTTTTTLPTGWSQNGPDANTTWSGVNTSNAGGAANEMVLDAISAGFSDSGTYTLNTPVVNATNFSNLNLKFKNYVNSYDPVTFPFTLKIQTSPNGSTGWTDRWTFTPTISGAIPASTVSVDLSALDNNNSIYIRFAFVGRSFGLFRWAVDDVILMGSSPTQSIITWSPTLGLYTDNSLTTPYTGQNLTNVFAAPDSDTNYTASTNLANCNESKIQSVSARLKKVFTGLSATPTLWDEPNNWTTNTIPTSDKCVSIPNNKNVVVNIPDAAAKKVILEDGGSLTINANQTLTLQDELINGNTGLTAADKVVIASDGNLIQINPDAANSGLITANREAVALKNSATAKDYVYWSSPVAGQKTKGQTSDSFSPGTPNNRFYSYRESNDRFYETSDPTFVAGKGYAVLAESTLGSPYTKTYTFKGTLNNGDKNIPVTRSVDTTSGNPPVISVHGYNMVGNPYPSNIDFEKLYTANSTKINKIAYFWTNASFQQFQGGSGYLGNNYAVYTGTGGNPATSAPTGYTIPTGIIKVGQGFIIQSKGAVNSSVGLNFQNTMRVGDPGTFYQKDAVAKNRFTLQLTSPDQLINSQLIGYVAGASDGYEQDYDAEAFSLSSNLFFSTLNDKRLLIQGRSASFSTQDKVSLGANFFQSGNYTIALAKGEGIFDAGQSVYLRDKLNNVVTNLSQGVYSFTSNAGENTGRFEIIYEPESVLATDVTTKEELVVYKDSGDFVVKAPSKKITDVQVFDMNGRLILKIQPNNTKAVIPAASFTNGVYLLKVNQNGVITHKKVIK